MTRECICKCDRESKSDRESRNESEYRRLRKHIHMEFMMHMRTIKEKVDPVMRNRTIISRYLSDHGYSVSERELVCTHNSVHFDVFLRLKTDQKYKESHFVGSYVLRGGGYQIVSIKTEFEEEILIENPDDE